MNGATAEGRVVARTGAGVNANADEAADVSTEANTNAVADACLVAGSNC